MTSQLVALDVAQPIWDRFFSVFPLVLVGTREPDGGYDLAPKHMAMPLSFDNLFGFVCTPTHGTWQNAQRTGAFTVSYPGPEHIVMTSLAAAPREADDAKPSLAALTMVRAERVDGVLVDGSLIHLECELERTVDGLGEADNSLVIGRVVACRVHPSALRGPDHDDHDLINARPVLAYLYPGRFAPISASFAFPFHVGFKR